jgi:glycosyltransferase involved in cell wall biosynthesis
VKILLVGNFAPDAQESMQRFAQLLESGLGARGHAVCRIAPTPRLSRLARPYRYSGWPKLLGYVDKFVLFPRALRRRIAAFAPEIVHLADHSNAIYGADAGRTPVVATCHDLLQVRAARGEIPTQSVGWSGRRYQAWILAHLGRLPHVACISRATRHDVLRLTRLRARDVSLVPNALNFPYQPVAAEAARTRLAPFGVPANFLLSVGGGHWYKNRPGLLQIYADLRRSLSPPPALVMVGPPLSIEDAAFASGLGVMAHILPLANVTNAELAALYSLADALVFPSWEEGFGWPLAEAQACGCPIFVSNRAPMTDVVGPDGFYFDPAKPAEAARTIAEAWPGRTRHRAAGLIATERWRPERMLGAYEKIYRQMTL